MRSGARLDLAEHLEFLAYGEAIERAYLPAADGKVLMRFSRLFIVAERQRRRARSE